MSSKNYTNASELYNNTNYNNMYGGGGHLTTTNVVYNNINN